MRAIRDRHKQFLPPYASIHGVFTDLNNFVREGFRYDFQEVSLGARVWGAQIFGDSCRHLAEYPTLFPFSERSWGGVVSMVTDYPTIKLNKKFIYILKRIVLGGIVSVYLRNTTAPHQLVESFR